MGAVVLTGAMRWGRTRSGQASMTSTMQATVIAMAGRVRRASTPMATPRAKANAA